MNNQIKQGDLVYSLAGRDKGKFFIVIAVSESKVKVVDGKTRKVNKPKVKNPKHLKKVNAVSLNSIAVEINGEKPVGNERVYKQIKAVIKNKEDKVCV